MELLRAPQNLPFVIALGLVVALAGLQIVALLLGGTLEHGDFDLHPHIDLDIHPDLDLDMDADLDGDLDLDGDGMGGWTAALDWLGVGKLPLSILLTLWAASFGLAGLTIQEIAKSATGARLPLILPSLLALGLSFPLLKISGMILRPIMPRDETEAVTTESLLGSEGEIVVGTAKRGRPAQARVKDKWGTAHYVQVEPESDVDEFPAGSKVLLLKRHDHVFSVIAGSNAQLD